MGWLHFRRCSRRDKINNDYIAACVLDVTNVLENRRFSRRTRTGWDHFLNSRWDSLRRGVHLETLQISPLSARAYETGGFSFDVQQCCSKDFPLLSTSRNLPLPKPPWTAGAFLIRREYFYTSGKSSLRGWFSTSTTGGNETKREKATQLTQSIETRRVLKRAIVRPCISSEISLFRGSGVVSISPLVDVDTRVKLTPTNPLTKMIFTLGWTRSIGGEGETAKLLGPTR